MSWKFSIYYFITSALTSITSLEIDGRVLAYTVALDSSVWEMTKRNQERLQI